MKARIRPVPQPDSIVVRLSDPAALAQINDSTYEAWAEARQAEDTAAFNSWLCSPAGQKWLESEVAADAERRCISMWEGW